MRKFRSAATNGGRESDGWRMAVSRQQGEYFVTVLYQHSLCIQILPVELLSVWPPAVSKLRCVSNVSDCRRNAG